MSVRLLAIETASDACSSALYDYGEITERFDIAPRMHTELLLDMLDDLLQEKSLTMELIDGIAFGRGPGAFTGVRVATAMAQGIAFAASIPLFPVSSLQTLAQGIFRQHGVTNVMAGFDARMQEVYWGAYTLNDGLMIPVIDESVCKPEETPVLDGEWFAAGSAWQSYQDVLSIRHGQVAGIDDEFLPHARDLLVSAKYQHQLNQGVQANAALPTYLRNQVTFVK